jgi:hypothetical protein
MKPSKIKKFRIDSVVGKAFEPIREPHPGEREQVGQALDLVWRKHGATPLGDASGTVLVTHLGYRVIRRRRPRPT